MRLACVNRKTLANLPKPLIDRINALIIDAQSDAEVRGQFLKLGYTLRPY